MPKKVVAQQLFVCPCCGERSSDIQGIACLACQVALIDDEQRALDVDDED